jgi:hypothetical protein
MSTVRRSVSHMRNSSRCRDSRVKASREPKGSSSSSILGCSANARAMPTRCCIPPDSCADLEFALASAAGLITPETVVVTTVHELQVRPGGMVPTAPHDAPVDLIVTPERMIDCRAVRGSRPPGEIRWDELTEEKIAAIPLLRALRAAVDHRP